MCLSAHANLFSLNSPLTSLSNVFIQIIFSSSSENSKPSYTAKAEKRMQFCNLGELTLYKKQNNIRGMHCYTKTHSMHRHCHTALIFQIVQYANVLPSTWPSREWQEHLMQCGFLVESPQKAIFTGCYVCIFQTDCCRRQELGGEQTRLEWNSSHSVLCEINHNADFKKRYNLLTFLQNRNNLFNKSLKSLHKPTPGVIKWTFKKLNILFSYALLI